MTLLPPKEESFNDAQYRFTLDFPESPLVSPSWTNKVLEISPLPGVIQVGTSLGDCADYNASYDDGIRRGNWSRDHRGYTSLT